MGTSHHQISVDKAAAMTRKYRENRPGNSAICETFDADAVMGLLSDPTCKFLRIYYGTDQEGEVHAILIGANERNEDILPPDPAAAAANESAGDAAGPLEDGYRCPQDCPPKSKLNS